MPIPATTGQFRTRFEDMEIGDYIAFKVAGTSGVPCVISEIGASLATAQANEIPITGNAAPIGYAYALKVDKGLCITDRPIQHSVSWDALNNAKMIQGLVQVVNSKQILIRSLTGGNAYLGTDGKSSLTDKGLGAFPMNEWDKFIVSSNLGGKITAGDDNVWHWKNASNMVQDTVVNGVRIDSINVTNSSSTTRVLRGNFSKQSFGFPATDINGSPRPSSTVGGDIVFRPVFQFLEPNSKASNLFY